MLMERERENHEVVMAMLCHLVCLSIPGRRLSDLSICVGACTVRLDASDALCMGKGAFASIPRKFSGSSRIQTHHQNGLDISCKVRMLLDSSLI
jgi:hypothetical protein